MGSKYLYPILALLLLGACASGAAPEKRAQTARAIATRAGMHRQVIDLDGFDLTVFVRPGTGPVKTITRATVYIEGDGLAWAGRYRPSPDPTPVNPVALRLAAAHARARTADMVIYMARPCQYSGGTACSRAMWTGKRFAPAVITAMDGALTQLAAQYGIETYALVGFSGGGAVAALLAARRDDAGSLRTVAGNLDHRAHSEQHGVSLLAGSLNPPDQAARLRAVPQIHFIGAADDNVTPAIYESYARALGATACSQRALVAGAGHEEGWAAVWPVLLARDVRCD